MLNRKLDARVAADRRVIPGLPGRRQHGAEQTLGAVPETGRIPFMIIWAHRPGPGPGRGLGLGTLLP
jgi:hypothetical protein